MVRGIIYYNLRGVDGWSKCQLSKLDISKIIHIATRPRIFMIFQKDYPYTMIIEYKLPITKTKVSTIIDKNNRIVINTFTESTQVITKRYKTEEDMELDCKNIMDMKRDLEIYSEQLGQEIIKKIREKSLNKHIEKN